MNDNNSANRRNGFEQQQGQEERLRTTIPNRPMTIFNYSFETEIPTDGEDLDEYETVQQLLNYNTTENPESWQDIITTFQDYVNQLHYQTPNQQQSQNDNNNRPATRAPQQTEQIKPVVDIQGQTQCNICIENLSKVQTYLKLACGHTYCVKCMITWAFSDRSNKKYCSVCQRYIFPEQIRTYYIEQDEEEKRTDDQKIEQINEIISLSRDIKQKQDEIIQKTLNM